VHNKLKAICWSLMILTIAVAGYYGVIDRQAAQTLTITLPVVAWMMLTGRAGCRWRKA